MVFESVLVVAYAIVLAGMAVLALFAPFQGWLMERLGTHVGLGIPVDLEAKIRARVRQRTMGQAIGGLAGLVVAVAACAVAISVGAFPGPSARFDIPSFVELYGVIAVTATGSGLGVGWAALRGEAVRPDGPRIARARAVMVGDYLPLILRVGCWPLLGLAAATIAVIVAENGLTVVVVPGAALVVVGIGGLVTSKAVSRRIVGRGRPASGTDELVWDDALRSEALRDLLYPPLYAVMFGAWWSLAGPGDSLAAPLALLPAGLGLLGLVLYAFVFRHTRTWYLEELWPGSRRRTADEEQARLAAKVAVR